jgi:hypothetical protein
MRQKASQPWLALGMSRATWYRLGKPQTKPERPMTQPLRARLMNVSLRSLQRGERVARSAPGLADQVAAGALKVGRAERLLFSATFKEMRQKAVNETPQRRSSGGLTIVRLTHIDGKLPNLALMKIAAEHRRRGDSVVFTKHVERSVFEPTYDRVYGSAIFAYDHSLARVATLKREFPNAIVGGTHNLANPVTVEAVLGIEETAPLDYSIYPAFDASIGFTQRGCRLKCGFCVVPKKEGKNRSAATIADIWRGAPYPKHLHLLDNDFFGQPRDQWEARVDEIRAGGFRVCFNQGINVRMVDDASAKALASIRYTDDSFTRRRLYTAWDSLGDEERFFDGVATLERYGVPASHVMAYMLVGYDRRETWERVLYRFKTMAALGIRPFPMVYGDRHRKLPLGSASQRLAHRTLGDFQRWAVRRAYVVAPFEDYDVNAKGAASSS